MTPTGDQMACPTCGRDVGTVGGIGIYDHMVDPGRCPTCSMRTRVIEAAMPGFRLAVARVMAGNGAHVFTLAEGTNSQTGVQSQLSCFVTQQHVGILLEGVLAAAAASEQFIMQKMQEAGAFGKVTQ